MASSEIFPLLPGKDSKINVIRLADFEGEQNEMTARTKSDLKDHKLERTKGMYDLLYSDSTGQSGMLLSGETL